MRASLLLLAGAGVLAGVGLMARPGEPAPAGGGIIVVRGAATAAERRAQIVPAALSPAQAPVAAAPDPRAEFGDPGVWATPAEFAPPEPAD